MLTAKDWTLLVVAAANRGPMTPVQLQKSLFLIARTLSTAQLGATAFYSFRAYDYGPFCAAVYADAENLEAHGLVRIARPPASRYKLFQITRAGAERAAEVRMTLSRNVLKYLDGVVDWTQALSFNQLVSAIYAAHPDMRVNSVFTE